MNALTTWIVLSIIPMYMCQTYYVIPTLLGDVKGILHNVTSGAVVQFRNIPYAKPPIGDLRFRKPEPFGKWNGTLDATEFGPSCVQDPMRLLIKPHNPNISEDCLSLNIYVPDAPAPSGKKSVMIWIHGGGFTTGAAQMYDATYLSLRGDVIVVTINYRLGILGFLSTMDSASRGNYGLWDQHLAFQWVHKNIRSFGGDPSSVTIFGESAGSFSVNLHALLPKNNGLFQRVIAESGVSNSNIGIQFDALHQAQAYGRVLNCGVRTPNEHLVSCLKQQPTVQLLVAQSDPLAVPQDRVRFTSGIGPVVDGDLVPDYPRNLLSNTSSESYTFFKSLDFMTGNCNKEGSLFTFRLPLWASIYGFNETEGMPTSFLCTDINPGLVSDLYGETKYKSKVESAICNKYKNSDEQLQANSIMDLYGDVLFVVPTVEILSLHSRNNTSVRSYQYMFNRRSPVSLGLIPTYKWFHGAAHASEILFLFGLQDASKTFHIAVEPSDLQLSELMLKYWTNFAKTGNPNGPGLVNWPVFDEVNQSYLSFNTLTSATQHVFQDRVIFWSKTIPNILHGIH